VEIYFSTDIEADGPIPGKYSMLSFGSAAFNSSGQMLDTFAANLDTLPGASQHPDTMDWWKSQTAAWEAHRQNTRPAEAVMPEYVRWVNSVSKKFNGRPVFVGYPAGFDFLFMYWYLINFAGESPFSFSALDMKTYAMAKLGVEYRAVTKRKMPRDWFSNTKKHTHVALDDAIEQGELFIKMLRSRCVRR